MLKDYAIIIIAIIVLGIGFVFIENKLSTPKPTATKITPTENLSSNQTFTTSDGRVSMTFPTTWFVKDTTQKGSKGKFGTNIQTWTITSYAADDNPAIPPNGVKIDFTVEQGGGNLSLNALLDCGGKTLSCETIGIDNEQFLESKATLNTDMKTKGLATFYDQNVFIGNAQVQTGDRQSVNEKEVEKIFQSIKFSQ